MKRKIVNPATVYQTARFGFSQAVVQETARTLHVSGQVAWDRDSKIVGDGDLGTQARQALANLKAVLAEAGATPADVVRMRIYVVGYTPDKFESIGPEIAAFYGGADPGASTLIGVQALARPEFLIEIEADAALD
jgi:enamine deaminase RidA (YjgF/YER057c/UK114 family)